MQRSALTDRGRDLIDAAITAHVGNEQRILASLTNAGQEQLSGLLAKLLAEL